jgi:hypothetical protein
LRSSAALVAASDTSYARLTGDLRHERHHASPARAGFRSPSIKTTSGGWNRPHINRRQHHARVSCSRRPLPRAAAGFQWGRRHLAVCTLPCRCSVGTDRATVCSRCLRPRTRMAERRGGQVPTSPNSLEVVRPRPLAKGTSRGRGLDGSVAPRSSANATAKFKYQRINSNGWTCRPCPKWGLQRDCKVAGNECDARSETSRSNHRSARSPTASGCAPRRCSERDQSIQPSFSEVADRVGMCTSAMLSGAARRPVWSRRAKADSHKGRVMEHPPIRRHMEPTNQRALPSLAPR